MASWACGLCEIERPDRRIGYKVVAPRWGLRELAEKHLDREHPAWRAGTLEQRAEILESLP